MPQPYRPVLRPAGLKHPKIREFLAVKRRPAGTGESGTGQRSTGPSSDGQPGQVALEGTWLISQALAAGLSIRTVFVCPALLQQTADGTALVTRAVSMGAEAYVISERVLARIADRDRPDGIAALGQTRPRTLGDIRVRRRARVVIADGWDLPGNLGTLIRCADGAGASGVLVVEQGFGMSHPLVVRASMGAALTMPVAVVSRPAARRWLAEHGFNIVAADPGGDRSYRDADYRGPLAIVVGSERRGLAPEWLTAADSIVAIPMLGSCDSLNAAVAAALLLYEGLARDSDQSSRGSAQILDEDDGTVR